MSANDADEFALDLTAYSKPADLDAAWVMVLADARREEGDDGSEGDQVTDSSTTYASFLAAYDHEGHDDDPLPRDYDRWTADQREAWMGNPDVSLHERRGRTRLHRAWLAQRPDADQPRSGTGVSRPVFADVAAILDGRLRAQAPDGGPARTDGACVFYRGKVNALIGDPESAKTLLALAVLADELIRGGVAVFIDTDHNGAEFVLRFLLALSVSREVLVERFHYAEPDDRADLLRVIEAAAELDLGSVVLDSIGENLSLWGVSPNDDQGVIDMNRATAARLAKAGHVVITIDHLAKNLDSRKYGATGSTAKLRAANGAVYEIRVVDEFSPNDGGKSALILKKDRTGGVRALGYKRNDTVALFEVTSPDSATGNQIWMLHPGSLGGTAVVAAAATAASLAADVGVLAALTPPPTSKDDVMKRLKWGTRRALAALKAWRSQTPGNQP